MSQPPRFAQAVEYSCGRRCCLCGLAIVFPIFYTGERYRGTFRQTPLPVPLITACREENSRAPCFGRLLPVLPWRRVGGRRPFLSSCLVTCARSVARFLFGINV